MFDSPHGLKRTLVGVSATSREADKRSGITGNSYPLLESEFSINLQSHQAAKEIKLARCAPSLTQGQ